MFWNPNGKNASPFIEGDLTLQPVAAFSSSSLERLAALNGSEYPAHCIVNVNANVLIALRAHLIDETLHATDRDFMPETVLQNIARHDGEVNARMTKGTPKRCASQNLKRTLKPNHHPAIMRPVCRRFRTKLQYFKRKCEPCTLLSTREQE